MGPIRGAEEHGFTWTQGSGMVDLGTLGGTYSSAYAINDAGQTAGASTTFGGQQSASRYTPGVGMEDLGVLPGASSAQGWGINNLGQVVGESNERSFLWTEGVGMVEIGPLPGATYSMGMDINDSGQVSFHSDSDATGGMQQTYIWTEAGGIVDLGTLGGAWNYGYDINNAGQVVGAGETSTGETHAFRYTDGVGMEDIGVLPGGTYAEAYGINELGQVVGASATSTEGHAFLWTEENGMVDLNDLLPPDSGWDYLEDAWGINDAGWIVGNGYVNGEYRSFVMIPEPATLLLLTLGGLACMRRRR